MKGTPLIQVKVAKAGKDAIAKISYFVRYVGSKDRLKKGKLIIKKKSSGNKKTFELDSKALKGYTPHKGEWDNLFLLLTEDGKPNPFLTEDDIEIDFSTEPASDILYVEEIEKEPSTKPVGTSKSPLITSSRNTRIAIEFEENLDDYSPYPVDINGSENSEGDNVKAPSDLGPKEIVNYRDPNCGNFNNHLFLKNGGPVAYTYGGEEKNQLAGELKSPQLPPFQDPYTKIKIHDQSLKPALFMWFSVNVIKPNIIKYVQRKGNLAISTLMSKYNLINLYGSSTDKVLEDSKTPSSKGGYIKKLQYYKGLKPNYSLDGLLELNGVYDGNLQEMIYALLWIFVETKIMVRDPNSWTPHYIPKDMHTELLKEIDQTIKGSFNLDAEFYIGEKKVAFKNLPDLSIEKMKHRATVITPKFIEQINEFTQAYDNLPIKIAFLNAGGDFDNAFWPKDWYFKNNSAPAGYFHKCYQALIFALSGFVHVHTNGNHLIGDGGRVGYAQIPVGIIQDTSLTKHEKLDEFLKQSLGKKIANIFEGAGNLYLGHILFNYLITHKGLMKGIDPNDVTNTNLHIVAFRAIRAYYLIETSADLHQLDTLLDPRKSSKNSSQLTKAMELANRVLIGKVVTHENPNNDFLTKEAKEILGEEISYGQLKRIRRRDREKYKAYLARESVKLKNYENGKLTLMEFFREYTCGENYKYLPKIGLVLEEAYLHIHVTSYVTDVIEDDKGRERGVYGYLDIKYDGYSGDEEIKGEFRVGHDRKGDIKQTVQWDGRFFKKDGVKDVERPAPECTRAEVYYYEGKAKHPIKVRHPKYERYYKRKSAIMEEAIAIHTGLEVEGCVCLGPDKDNNKDSVGKIFFDDLEKLLTRDKAKVELTHRVVDEITNNNYWKDELDPKVDQYVDK